MLPTIKTRLEKHILKPWWDTFTDYISIFMMIISAFGIFLQNTRENMTCMPCGSVDNKQCGTLSAKDAAFSTQNVSIIPWDVYASNFCYEQSVHWFGKYAPYLLIFHTLVFVTCSQFLFTIPCTSSNLDKFVSILLECNDSPWTTKALSETVVGESDLATYEKKNTWSEEEARMHLRQRTKSRIETKILGRKDGEQAKALFEKVKKFRMKVEKGDVIYLVYICQTIVKILNVVLLIIYLAYYVKFIEFNVVCPLKVASYSSLSCINTSAYPFKFLILAYVLLGVLYGFSCLYTVSWMFNRPLKTYSFEAIREESSYRDIPDMMNDFAFMLHLTDQYDPLYTERFAVFLSESSEKRLRQLNLDNEWKPERLSQHMITNRQGKLELQLFKLTGMPNIVFELKELEVLKLVLSPFLIIPSHILQLSNLTEMWLCHTPAEIEDQALAFLIENLKTLHVTFSDYKEIPKWIGSLKNLNELHLTGNLGFIELGDLKMLKVLYLKNNLSKLPQAVADLQLQKLSIRNNGTKLTTIDSIKKMTKLMELELVACSLDHIPSAIFSLNNLRELDLKYNKLTAFDQFPLPRRLVCLKLWHNNITYIPNEIGRLAKLQRLYVSNNKIERISEELFSCLNLQILDLSHNKLTSISANVGRLQKLQHFAVTANMVRSEFTEYHSNNFIDSFPKPRPLASCSVSSDRDFARRAFQM